MFKNISVSIENIMFSEDNSIIFKCFRIQNRIADKMGLFVFFEII